MSTDRPTYICINLINNAHIGYCDRAHLRLGSSSQAQPAPAINDGVSGLRLALLPFHSLGFGHNFYAPPGVPSLPLAYHFRPAHHLS